MDEITKIIKNNNLILIEDTCESMGPVDKQKQNIGTVSTFSSYYSHHICTLGRFNMFKILQI